MKVRARIILAVILAFALTQCCLADAERPRNGRYIIHTTGAPAVNEKAGHYVEEHAGLILKELATGTGLVTLISERAARHMKNISGVVAVEPDVVVSAVKGPPPDRPRSGPKKHEPEQPEQVVPWGVVRIDAELAWNDATGSGIDIAIIDTGIDNDHKDLAYNLAGGMNFVGKKRGHWNDDNGHGSSVAGIAAAVDNSIGVVGAAPAARLWAVKVLDKNGNGYLSDVINGIYWAADKKKVGVINLSLGIEKELLEQYPADLQLFQDAVDNAYEAGVVLVAAAGNSGNTNGVGDNVLYPARFESVIAVAATDSHDNRAWFSSTGPSVELAAPGVSIFSTSNNGLYKKTFSGTSAASPHAAATAALVLSSDETLSNVDVRLILQETADDLGPLGDDDLYGFGLVDAEEAATALESSS